MKISNKEILRSVFMAVVLLVMMFFIINSQLHAEVNREVANKKNSEIGNIATSSGFITTESQTAIKDDESIIDGRERTINIIKEDALLREAGTFIHPALVQKEKNLLLKILKPHQDVLIKEMKILSEAERPDKTYWIKATFRIDRAYLEELLMKNLYKDRAIVITLEKNLKKPLKRNILEHDLIARIKQKGYIIVDYRAIKNERVNALVSAIKQGNTRAVRQLGLYYLADLVVVGFVETAFSEKNMEIYSSHATGQVKIHQIGNYKELGSLTRYDVKGFGSDEEKSGLDAIKKITPVMSEEAMKSLTGKSVHQVKISMSEIGNYAAYEKAKNYLMSLSYIRSLREGRVDFKEEEATLYVRTTDGIGVLVNKISDLKKFVITKVNGTEIWLEARKIN